EPLGWRVVDVGEGSLLDGMDFSEREALELYSLSGDLQIKSARISPTKGVGLTDLSETQVVASLKLLREMLSIRLVEETIATRYAEQEMRCPVHLSIGQEGIAVGVCQALRESDRIFSTHRCHAHYL